MVMVGLPECSTCWCLVVSDERIDTQGLMDRVPRYGDRYPHWIILPKVLHQVQVECYIHVGTKSTQLGMWKVRSSHCRETGNPSVIIHDRPVLVCSASIFL